jgi:hypothetical protein
MAKLKTHTAPDKSALEHRSSPRRSGDGDRYGFRAILRMSGDERRTLAKHHDGVAVVLCLHFEYGGLGKVPQEDAALNLRLRDLVVDLVAEVRMGRERWRFESQKILRLLETV